MGPTGVWTIVIAAGLAVWAVFFTILLWNRGGRARYAFRIGGILLCEVLILLTGGLVVNRAENLFPTWGALIADAANAKEATFRSGRLDDWLRARHGEGERDGLAFEWQAKHSGDWALTSPPHVSLPREYFTDAKARLPVVVVLAVGDAGRAQAAWEDKAVRAAAGAADPAVAVFVRLPRTGDAASTIGTALVTELGHDLRVYPNGWAIVGIGPAAATAVTVARAPTGNYSALALVAGNGSKADFGGLPSEVTTRAAELAATGVPATVVAGAPGSGLAVIEVAAATDRLTAALRWASRTLPPRLSPPLDVGAPR